MGNYTHINAYGVEVLVQLESTMVWTVNKDLKVKVVKVVDGKGNMQIPAGTCCFIWSWNCCRSIKVFGRR